MRMPREGHLYTCVRVIPIRVNGNSDSDTGQWEF